MRTVRDRVLMTAVAASIAVHCAWLFAFRAVTPPSDHAPIRYSRVSFLGRGVLKVAIERRERTFLENRYLAMVRGLPVPVAPEAARESETKKPSVVEGGLTPLIEEAVSGSKVEPLFTAN